ncbi:MAG TPA: hypothetical protein PLU88_10740 [Armatimonadota bacterium]|nr:hypothetical protein [Armatimonadota bacterium]HPP75585.1 hypothetical protein [Armatimonadota bacterium]
MRRKCDTQIDLLKEEVDYDIWIFRWIWFINLFGTVWGLLAGHFDMVVLAVITSLVALLGIGRTRRNRKLVDQAANVCLPADQRYEGPSIDELDEETGSA